jgi:acetoin utilization protein AcuC
VLVADSVTSVSSVADLVFPRNKATLVDGTLRRQRPYRSSHPLAIPRTSLALDLIRAYGAVADGELVKARIAAPDELAWFHTPEYLAALRAAEARGRFEEGDRSRFGLGNLENPYFEQIYTIPATATGGSIVAAEALLAGRVAFNPAGGMHHARAGSAQGFCYFNDPVLAILRLKRAGLRVAYVDLDAHHCDGVEAAFADDPDVLTVSLHMDTRYAYPFRGGRLEDAGSEKSGHTTINVPLPAGTHDDEYRLVFDAVWPRAVERFAPDAIVLQAGADAIFADPLGKLRLSTQCLLEIAARVRDAAPRHADGTPKLMATGGGGYHPLIVARAWTGLWALLSGRALPEAIGDAGRAVLEGAGWTQDENEPHFPRLLAARTDVPAPLPVRDEVRERTQAVGRHPLLA